MYASTSVWTIILLEVLIKGCLWRADVKSVVLQPRAAKDSFHLLPFGGLKDRYFLQELWHIASPGLINSTAKFQVELDDLLLYLGLKRVIEDSRLFICREISFLLHGWI